MALREIPPLEEEHWNTLVNDLENGQTEDQAKFLQKAIANKNRFKVAEY